MYDETRARESDHAQWLDFESKTRETIQRMIVPVLKIAGEDRALTLELQTKLGMALKRIELLDEAVFLANN